jgi:hypothetical protein
MCVKLLTCTLPRFIPKLLNHKLCTSRHSNTVHWSTMGFTMKLHSNFSQSQFTTYPPGVSLHHALHRSHHAPRPLQPTPFVVQSSTAVLKDTTEGNFKRILCTKEDDVVAPLCPSASFHSAVFDGSSPNCRMKQKFRGGGHDACCKQA